MDQNPQQPPAPGNAPAPAPDGPTYIGNTNIVDRSSLPQTTPVLTALPPTHPDVPSVSESYNRAASSAFSEAKVLICGIASATSYLLIIYLTKSIWITAIISAILALAAIFFATSAYRGDSKVTPLTVVGLSAATITLVYVANLLLGQAFLHSFVAGYGL